MEYHHCLFHYHYHYYHLHLHHYLYYHYHSFASLVSCARLCTHPHQPLQVMYTQVGVLIPVNTNNTNITIIVYTTHLFTQISIMISIQLLELLRNNNSNNNNNNDNNN